MSQATPAHPTTVDASSIDRKLRGLWRRQRAFTHLRGGAAVLLALIGMVLAGLLVDWLLGLPPVARGLLLLGMIAAVVAVGYRQWWTRLQPFDARRAALQVERHHPQLGSSLIAYVQLGHSPDGSSQLVEAARQHALSLAEPLAFGQLVVFRELRTLMMGAVFAAVVLFGVGMQWPVALATFGERLLNPLSDRAYPTRTQVALLDADAIVPRGTPVTLAATVQGVQPPEGALVVRYEGAGRWESIRVVLDEEGRLVHRFASLDRGMEYYFRAGDGTSEPRRVDVVAPPRLRRVQVALDHPEYTGRGRTEATSLNIRAPEGTQVDWRLELDRPVAKAELLPLDGDGEPAAETHAFELNDAGEAATLSLPVQSWRYRLRWTLDVDGLDDPMVFDDPVQYQLHAVPDAPPQVQVLRPVRRSQSATTRMRLPIVFRASDDHGLAEAWVVYRRSRDDTEHRVSIGELTGRSADEQTFNWPLSETIEQLAVGDRIEYTIEVADNRDHEDGRQRGRAAPWRSIEVLSVEAFLRELAERQVDSFERLGQVREDGSESLLEVLRLEQEAP